MKKKEESINELRKILEYLKQIPREIDIDLLKEVLKIPKSVLKEAEKEIKIPDDIKAEYKNFENELRKYIKERKIKKNLRNFGIEKEDECFDLFFNKFNEIEKIEELYSKKIHKRIEKKYEKIEKRINKKYDRQMKKLNKQAQVKKD